MFFRRVSAACAALFISVAFVDALAYPITARSGTTTVTGTYRPLDLDLQLTGGNFFFNPNSDTKQTFALTGQLAGTFTSSYGASGTAGNWTLNLGFNSFNTQNFIRTGSNTSASILDENVTDSSDGNTVTLRIIGSARPVGSLVYTGGLSVNSGELPDDGSDTPNSGDMFLLYAHNGGDVFKVTVDDIQDPNDFSLKLAQDLMHLGPYVQVGDNLYALDDGSVSGGSLTSRVNADCEGGNAGCGSVPSDSFLVSSVGGANVPEPASLALVALGLAALALGRRRRSLHLV